MDTSELYVKMCEKAVEIQKLFVPSPSNVLWDWCAKYGQEKYDFVEYQEHIHQLVFKKYDGYEWMATWLPCQDQLQAILGYMPQEGISLICHWMGSERYAKYAFTFTSMEQLWLTFVMLEKYNKVWSTEKEDWVIGGNNE